MIPGLNSSDEEKRIYLSPPDVGLIERDYVLNAFDSGWIAPTGPDLDAFEAEVAERIGWCGAVGLTTATAGLHLALRELGVGPGDEVFVSSFTFVAPANTVTYCGGTPVFIDSEPCSWNMDPELLGHALDEAAARNRLPKAVVVVDLFGQCADYDRIVELCAHYDVPILEDAAESMGSTYRDRPAGTLGDIGVFSFNGNKVMTTSGGGMLVVDDVAVAERIRYLATQAREPVDHYEHTTMGFNYRLSNLLAALGRGQLTRLDEMVKQRCEINVAYRKAFADVHGLHFMPIPEWSGWNGWLTCVYFDDAARRDAVRQALAAVNIESRQLWKPMHLQPLFADARAFERGVSTGLFETGLCLPSGSGLTGTDLDRVVTTLLRATN